MLICGFDINRSNIPFGSLDVCVPNKIDDGTTAKAAHPSWSKNLLFERRGDHNVFEENLSACHVVVRIGIKVTLHRTRTTNGRPYRQDKDFLFVSHTEVHFVIEMTSGG